MILVDIANSMGISVNKLAEIMGYTRQGLHQIFDRKNDFVEKRMNSAMDTLESFIDNRYKKQIERTESEYQLYKNNFRKFRRLVICQALKIEIWKMEREKSSKLTKKG